MKATLDHVGIAVSNLADALAFYRDALGLEIEAPEEVASQRVRAHFIPAGEAALELLEATADDSPIAKYLAKRGPGLHHITLRVEDIAAALAQLKARGVRLIDEAPRPGAHGSLVAFIHPASAHGVLVELNRSWAVTFGAGSRAHLALRLPFPPRRRRHVRRRAEAAVGKRAPADERNRIRLATRPLLVRGERTMIIDAGIGDKMDAKSDGHLRHRSRRQSR